LVKDEQPIGPAGFPAAKTKGNQEETDEAVISGRTRVLRTGQVGPFLAAWNATVLLHHGTASRHVEDIFCFEKKVVHLLMLGHAVQLGRNAKS
jgi:hypothetical protein